MYSFETFSKKKSLLKLCHLKISEPRYTFQPYHAVPYVALCAYIWWEQTHMSMCMFVLACFHTRADRSICLSFMHADSLLLLSAGARLSPVCASHHTAGKDRAVGQQTAEPVPKDQQNQRETPREQNPRQTRPIQPRRRGGRHMTDIQHSLTAITKESGKSRT